MKLNILILLLNLMVCSVSVKAQELDTLHCITLKGNSYLAHYKIVDIKNHQTDKRVLKLVKDDIVIQTLPMFTQDDYNGFSVNWIRPTRSGFELSLQYGSIIYFCKVFQFYYKNNNFYLNRIKTVTFNKAKPQKLKTEITKVPDIALSKLRLSSYM